MTRSTQQPSSQWTPSWDAMKLLQLEKTTDKSFFNCVGDTLKGRRCGCQIAKHNVEWGQHLLSQLPRRSINPQLLEEDLRAIAYKLLCVRWHRDGQVERMVQRWRPIVVAENARSRARIFQSQTRQTKQKMERKASFAERKFKEEEEEEEEDRKTSNKHPKASEAKAEDSQTSSNARTRRTAFEQEQYLRREKERCEEARRQSRRERAEQKEAKDRAERERAKRQEEEEARQRKREENPPPRSQPRPSSTEEWEISWNTYRQRWMLVKDLPANTTLADLEKVFPWPSRNMHQLGLSIAKLDAAFERDVESFFRHMSSQQAAGAVGEDKKVVLKALRKKAHCWHPDKVLVRFPVGAVPKVLRELATKITQVLTRTIDGYFQCMSTVFQEFVAFGRACRSTVGF